MPLSISRRQFIKRSLSLMGAVSLGRAVDLSSLLPHKLSAEDFPQAVVAQGTDQNTPAEILKLGLDAIGGLGRFVKPGQVVAIKPNATWAFPPHTASSTDPDILRALIQMVKDAGAARIIVTDHCSIEPGTARCLAANGLGAVVEEAGVEAVFPDRYLAPKETYTIIDLPEGHAFKKIGVVKAAVDADVRINMGVAKSHSVTRMTLALKHMMGFLETPASLHAYLHKGIADINTSSSIHADLHILEALRIRMAYGDYITCGGPETDVTHPFMIKRKNQMIVGVDPVLMDAYACSTFYAVKPKELAHLKNAADWGIGDLEVEAAKTSGKLLLINVGDPLPAHAAILPTPGPQETVVLNQAEIKTPTPIPLSGEAEANQVVGAVTNSQQNYNTIVSPNDFLNTALIPASVILVGAGMVAARKKLPLDHPTDEPPPHDEQK
ncbi:MAG TPA: DUF362 domain-containing protein [Leptolinea sp.]